MYIYIFVYKYINVHIYIYMYIDKCGFSVPQSLSRPASFSRTITDVRIDAYTHQPTENSTDDTKHQLTHIYTHADKPTNEHVGNFLAALRASSSHAIRHSNLS